MAHYRKHLSEPWFSFIRDGVKTSEGRVNDGVFAKMAAGDTVEWFNKDQSFTVNIKSISHYPSFEAMVRGETLKRTLPGYKKIKDGVNEVYYRYYTKEQESKYGVIAIRF